MTELKPCPFCGGKAEFTCDMVMFDSNDRPVHLDMRPVRIACKGCGAAIKEVPVSNKYCANDLAAEAWNRRTQDSDGLECAAKIIAKSDWEQKD